MAMRERRTHPIWFFMAQILPDRQLEVLNFYKGSCYEKTKLEGLLFVSTAFGIEKHRALVKTCIYMVILNIF